MGIYVHLPFCRVHCTYCPFAISTNLALQDRYTDAVIREIEARSGGLVDSLYFGGGTPSLLSTANFGRLVATLSTSFALAPDVEFSIESNPEDITDENLDAWTAFGVNRISIGVQSFSDEELRPIGRLHGAELARQAVRRAAARGLKTNLDLIAGLPGQDLASFAATLDEAISCGAGHLSLYMLDLEERTPLEIQVRRGRVAIPDDELVAEMYLAAVERLRSAGLLQYEVSNFARAGEECRHNLRYWTRGDYLGFGMSAHSFTGSRRFANTRNIHDYIGKAPGAVDFEEQLGDAEVRREVIFLGLRRTTGLNSSEIIDASGEEGSEWIERGLRDGWLKRDGERVSFTPSGFLSSSELISQLF